ncbi:RHS repeat-associated core domain-containing protein, partial [Haloplasma contractile]
NLSEKNPYRYRGYRFDEETGWYYLNSRYYNPEWGRFINQDGILGETGDLLGHNLYAYTQNNPVIRQDSSGYCYESINPGLGLGAPSTCGGGSGNGGRGMVSNSSTNEGKVKRQKLQKSAIIKDLSLIGFNPYNSNEDLVLESTYFSFYKGSPIIWHNIPNQSSAGVFGMVFLNSNTGTKQTLKHEWGHNQQERILGTPLYLLVVAAPSVYYNKTGDYRNYRDPKRERMYYSKVWERIADWFGGVDRNNYDPFWSKSNFVPW